MKTTTETFYVICLKGDHTKIMKDFGSYTVTSTDDLSEAWTDRNSTRLFFMLEEYSSRFKGEWEVVKIVETTTVDHVGSVVERS